jgi:hypothetical protein
MPSGREELRRGVRDLIEIASREMEALEDPTPPAPPVAEAEGGSHSATPATAQRDSRPILRLVRDVAPAPAEMPAPAHGPTGAPDVIAGPSKKGVCAAYYVSRKCWEVADAYCNQALHVCMLRECPVYHLNREELEQRFARKFSHLW